MKKKYFKVDVALPVMMVSIQHLVGISPWIANCRVECPSIICIHPSLRLRPRLLLLFPNVPPDTRDAKLRGEKKEELDQRT